MVVVGGYFLDWRPIINSVLPKSMLGLLLFIIYINDQEDNLFGIVREFVDEAKIGGVVDSGKWLFKVRAGYRATRKLGQGMTD